MCIDHTGLTDIFTKDECIAAVPYAKVSLSPYARFKEEVLQEDAPKGCFISGRDIYWNTHGTGRPKEKIKSICKSGNRLQNIYILIDYSLYYKDISKSFNTPYKKVFNLKRIYR